MYIHFLNILYVCVFIYIMVYNGVIAINRLTALIETKYFPNNISDIFIFFLDYKFGIYKK